MKSTSFLQSRLKSLHQTALKQLNEQQWVPALKTFQQVLAIAQETDSLQYRVEALHQIGTIHYSLKHYSLSIRCLKQILHLAPADSKSLRVATVCNDLARVYCAGKQYSQALRYAAQALEIFLKLSHLSGIGVTLNYLGEIYNHLGMFERAVECCGKALVIFQDFKDRPSEDGFKNRIHEAAALHNLGFAEYHLDRPGPALAFLERALEIREKLRSGGEKTGAKIDSETAKTLGQMGIVYFALKDYETALICYERAAKIYGQNDQSEERGKMMNYMGAACYKNGEISQALWYHLKALELLESLPNSRPKDNCLPHILSVYQRFNLSDQGVKLYRRVQQLVQMMETEVS